MPREIPKNLEHFLKSGYKDVDDGYEYSSELNRILNSDSCQTVLTFREIEKIREFADEVKKLGEMNYYTEERIKDLEREFFGSQGISGFLGAEQKKPFEWPF
ncbi:MAG TPA: hypothetical protein GXX49_06470 [Clostridiaceae bacterium]|nr:hypothetical protein [Clostridiaceae bacterium]